MLVPRPRTLRVLTPCVALLSLGSLASAQIGWAEFANETATRLSAPPGLGASDKEEKDYAWGDLDKDGWTDLVVVRKQPFTTSGRKQNVLLMNENGVLTDRTDLYAAATDTAGDQGFLTPTNDRDVVIVDVDLDGWLDVVTSTTISPGQGKIISHPRVYVNLGEDGSGNWLGLFYQRARIPNFGTFPNFCGIDAGDLTGDGYPDLYFAHYEQSAAIDLNDRLLVNDGNGFFTDESSARMTSDMLASSFGVSAAIGDMNGDGAADIVKDTALGQTGGSGPRVIVSYNDPSNVGYFNILQQAYAGAPYHASIGDLNQDGKLDMAISDDGADRYLLNQGNDALGRVKWSPPFTYQGNDDGFGSNNIIVDLNDDQWNDVLIADVDVEIPGCDRRMHIYHNKGGSVGGNVTLKEEVGGGFVGAMGLTANMLRGTHDVAIFDLDNDGDNDLVVGRCDSTEVWINALYEPDSDIGTNYCGPAAPNSTGLPAVMSANGSELAADNDVTLTASDMPPNQFGYFLTSQTQGFVMPPGTMGFLCLGGTIGRYSTFAKSTGAGGTFSLTIDLTNMPPPVKGQVDPGDTWNFQAWFRDNVGGPTSNFTDGVSITFS